MRTVTVAFWAITADLPELRGGRDTAAARLLPVDWIEDGDLHLAFDHDRIVRDAVERVRSRLETTTVAARFCQPAFTVAELRRVYEAIWNISLDPGKLPEIRARQRRLHTRTVRQVDVSRRTTLGSAPFGIVLGSASVRME